MDIADLPAALQGMGRLTPNRATDRDPYSVLSYSSTVYRNLRDGTDYNPVGFVLPAAVPTVASQTASPELDEGQIDELFAAAAEDNTDWGPDDPAEAAERSELTWALLGLEKDAPGHQ